MGVWKVCCSNGLLGPAAEGKQRRKHSYSTEEVTILIVKGCASFFEFHNNQLINRSKYLEGVTTQGYVVVACK